MEDKLKEIEERLKKLEEAIFKSKSSAVIKSSYGGPVGGVGRLIEAGFLDQPRSVKEIKSELEKEGCYYGIQAVDTSVRRDYMKNKRILTRFKEKDLWKYAVRK
jgi:hypothetical protein